MADPRQPVDPMAAQLAAHMELLHAQLGQCGVQAFERVAGNVLRAMRESAPGPPPERGPMTRVDPEVSDEDRALLGPRLLAQSQTLVAALAVATDKEWDQRVVDLGDGIMVAMRADAADDPETVGEIRTWAVQFLAQQQYEEQQLRDIASTNGLDGGL